MFEDIKIPRIQIILYYIYAVMVIISCIVFFDTVYRFLKMDRLNHQTSTIKVTSQTKEEPINYTIASVIKRNIFNVTGEVPDATETTLTSCLLTPKRTNLPYKIEGIIYSGQSKGSLVALASDGKRNNVFGIDDILPEGGKIHEILKDKVIIKVKNCLEFLSLEYSLPQIQSRSVQSGKQSLGSKSYTEPGFERNGNNTDVTRQWVNNVLNNSLSKVLQEARAVPNVIGGQVKGFQISQISENSVYAKLGLRNGDIISSINGIELNDVAKTIETLNSLRNKTNISLKIIRNGNTETLSVDIQ